MSDPTWGYTAGTAPPRLRELYEWLEPDPNAQYGMLLPFARDETATPPSMPKLDQYGVADVGETMNMPSAVRPAMPSMVRDFLTGGLDLPAGVDTGEVTPRAAVQLGLGGLGAGGALAPRGAVAMGGALPRWADTAGRIADARAMDFRMDRPLIYHGTNRPVVPGFSLTPETRATNAWTAREGIWAAENPQLAAIHADMAAPRGRIAGQNILPLVFRADRDGRIRIGPQDAADPLLDIGLAETIRNSFQRGYDALQIQGYPNILTGRLDENVWVFKNPNQLRSPFAAFDPAKRDSSDLLAGFAVPGPAPVPGLNVSPQPDRVPGLNVQPQPDASPGLPPPGPVRPFRARFPERPIMPSQLPDGRPIY